VKVEQGGVHYVERNALAGRAFRDIHDPQLVLMSPLAFPNSRRSLVYSGMALRTTVRWR
jgi:hypothetical protein